MGAAGTAAYQLGQEAAGSSSMSAGLGGMARAAGNAARSGMSDALGLRDAARSGRVTPAEAAYNPSDPQIAWGLAHFIADVRSVSLDPVLMRANWLEAYDFTTRRGAQFLSDYARVANPFGGIGERTVSVQVTSVVRASERSFQVKWIETAYERGVAAGATHWTAMITVVVKPPSSADALRKNPLGLYVDAIDWSRELEAPSPTAPPPQPPMSAALAPPPAAASAATLNQEPRP
ncbi:MAG: conjugal transfer protein TrbF [Sphingomonadaceae bacterium]|nr:conjugal transfer protein TrbF [Sphingomonadaceae bacterium]